MVEIRVKKNGLRIALKPVPGAMTVPYAAVEAKECWSSTWISWGTKAEDPIINLGGKQYRVSLNEVESGE